MLRSASLLLARSFQKSITDTVQDQSGAVIPQSQVNGNNVNTGEQLKALTNLAGVYFFSNLQPGMYTVTASHPASSAGFLRV